MNGRFIVFEGPDGSGTTTHSRRLTDTLEQRGLPVLHTFEATDGPVGTLIRQHLKSGGLPPSAMQLMFTADRAWHVEQVIRPALEAGTHVICDRYSLSTEIYGEAFGLSREWLHAMNSPFPRPDALILALPPLSVCMERLGIREKDTFEADDSLQKRVYDLYTAFAAQNPHISVIDTSASKDDSAMAIEKAVASVLESIRN